MCHLLTVLVATRWADHLVLRGSATMPAWVGEAAREPGDLDFVITPPTVTSDSVEAHALFAGITAALTATPGAGLRHKDLYDAVLLAEHTTVDLALVRELIRPHLGDEADRFTAATVLAWTDVDWRNFTDAYPGVNGTATDWLRRLALALDGA